MSAEQLPLLAQRLFNRPQMILPEKAEVIVAALASRLGIVRLEGLQASHAGDEFERLRQEALANGRAAPVKAYQMLGGVALIPIEGTLVAKLGGLNPWCGMTGYDQIRLKLALAMEDPEVRAVLLDIDSPGGEVAGCFDLVDAIHAARVIKPIWASLSEMACSAGYALASAAERIAMPRTGLAGSIGVVMMHVDWSAALAEAGIRVTMIHAGAHKVDGNPYQKLPDDVRETLAAACEQTRQLFAGTVARNRGMPIDAVLKTEAQVYDGQKTARLPSALDVGLVDAIEPNSRTLELLLAKAG